MSDNGSATVCALIGDLVSSRDAPDQQRLLDRLAEALLWTNARVAAVQDLAPTVGDEFQGVYRRPEDALQVSVLLSLKLRGDCEIRYGFGVGSMTRDASEKGYVRQSGPAWWRAREAIEEVVKLQGSKGWPASLRSRLRGEDAPTEKHMNAFLVCRDQVLAQMDAKDARIALALFLGERQTEIAEELGLAQSSVSTRQRSGGAAALHRAHQALTVEVGSE